MKMFLLSDICDIVIGKTPSRSVEQYWGIGYKWATISDLKDKYIYNTKEEITEAAIKATKPQKIPKGTVLLSFKLSIGKTAITGDELFTNEAIAALQIKDKSIVSAEYLYYVFKFIHLKGNQAAKGMVLNSKLLSNLKIPLPDNFDDQNEIVTILAKIDTVINKRKDILILIDKLQESLFFSYFGDPVQMSLFPKEKLGNYISFITSGSRDWAQHYVSEGEVFLRINNVGNAELKLKDIKHVKPPQSLEARRTKVRINDLLLSITADLGRTAVIDSSISGAYISQHLALIRLKNDRLNSDYVAWYFTMPYGKAIIEKYSKKSVKAALNFDDIKKLDIIIPPIKKQTEFATVMKKTQKIKALLQENLDDKETLKEALVQQVFTKKLIGSGPVFSSEPIDRSESDYDRQSKADITDVDILSVIQNLKPGYEIITDHLMDIFDGMEMNLNNYDKAKNAVFQMLAKENKGGLMQYFDFNNGSMKLRIT